MQYAVLWFMPASLSATRTSGRQSCRSRKASYDQEVGYAMKKGRESKPSKRELVLHKLEALAQSTTHAPEAETARAKAEELKIHSEIVQVARATERDPGTVTEGHWFLENGDTVVICDGYGVPRHHRSVRNRGRLLGDQNARQVARQLIRQMHGEDPSAGSYRQLRYPSAGPHLVCLATCRNFI